MTPSPTLIVKQILKWGATLSPPHLRLAVFYFGVSAELARAIFSDNLHFHFFSSSSPITLLTPKLFSTSFENPLCNSMGFLLHINTCGFVMFLCFHGPAESISGLFAPVIVSCWPPVWFFTMCACAKG